YPTLFRSRQAFHRTLLAVAVHDEALAVAAHADVEAVAVEQQRAADRARLDLQFHFELVGLVAGDHGQRRAVGRGAALALPGDRAVAEGQAVVLVPARVVKRPLVPEGRAVEGVGQRHAMRTDGLAAGLAQRLAEVAAAGQEPAVVGPLDRLQQRLPAKGPVSVLVAVVDHPPAAVGTFDHGGVAARPPRFVAAPGAGDRIVRRVLPRPVDRLGARGDHHVSGRRAGGAAHRGGHVVPLPALVDLRAFLGVALDVPALGVLPAVVDVLRFADHAQPVVGQLHVVAPAEEQVALPVLADRVARVDVLAQAQLHRLAPRAADVVGPHHPVAAHAALGAAGA